MKGLDVPARTEDFTADPVELFFDLAFVFAFSQLVAHLVHHPTWGGAGEAALIFVILWLAWSTFTWAANAVQGNTREVRAIFLVATVASVPMGASVTTAFSSGGGTFAVCASVIILMALGLQLWGVGSSGETNEFETVLRYSGPNIAAMALLIVGGFLDEGPRKVVWLLFVAAVVATIGYARQGDWIVRAGHFAERHGLIVIVALGEVVVAIGVLVVNSLTEADGMPSDTLAALVAAGVLVSLLWWAYFDRVSPALEHRGEALDGRDRAHFAADVYTGMHLPIVAGIITTAAATEEILLHPKDPIHGEFLVMFVAGVVLFYGGIAGCAYRAFRAMAKERIVAVVVIAVLAALATSMNALYFLLAVDVILVVTLLAENYRIEAPSAEAPAADAVVS